MRHRRPPRSSAISNRARRLAEAASRVRGLDRRRADENPRSALSDRCQPGGVQCQTRGARHEGRGSARRPRAPRAVVERAPHRALARARPDGRPRRWTMQATGEEIHDEFQRRLRNAGRGRGGRSRPGKTKAPRKPGRSEIQSPMAQAATLVGLTSRSLLELAIGIERGFIVSGISRTRSTCRSPFCRLAPLTFT
jgi:hypothetical protein